MKWVHHFLIIQLEQSCRKQRKSHLIHISPFTLAFYLFKHDWDLKIIPRCHSSWVLVIIHRYNFKRSGKAIQIAAVANSFHFVSPRIIPHVKEKPNASHISTNSPNVKKRCVVEISFSACVGFICSVREQAQTSLVIIKEKIFNAILTIRWSFIHNDCHNVILQRLIICVQNLNNKWVICGEEIPGQKWGSLAVTWGLAYNCDGWGFK